VGTEHDIESLRTDYSDGRLSRRQFMVRALALGLGVSGAGALLAACGSPKTATSTTLGSTGTTGTTSISTSRLAGTVQILVGFGTGNSPAQIKVQQGLANAFMRQNPDVNLQFLRVPGGSSNAGTKLTTLIAGGSAPAIAMPVGVYGISLFLDQGVWLDLEPYFTRDGLSLDSFLPSTYSAVHVPNYYGANSKAIVGVPIGVNDHAVAYNEALFTKAGVAVPPTSWSDPTWALEPGGAMLDAALKLTVDSKGRNASQAGFDPASTVQFGLANFFSPAVYYDFGGALYDPATRTAQFDTPDSIAGISFARDLVQRYHVKPSHTELATIGAGGSDAVEVAWRAGKLAMIDMCTCNLMTPYTTDVPFKWSLGAAPTGPKRRFVFLNLDLGAIVKPSANHDLAWEVLKYFTFDPAPEEAFAYDSDGAVPPLKVNSATFAPDVRKSQPGVDPQVWLDGLPYASEENESWFPAFAELQDPINTTFSDIVYGNTAPGVGMRQLQAKAQAAIDSWFKTHTLGG
jgi:ABC-type glycerol-3-phosphate transport system substrate-binding protein